MVQLPRYSVFFISLYFSRRRSLFSQRTLSEDNEISQLEAMSNHVESKETEQVFRFATVKVGSSSIGFVLQFGSIVYSFINLKVNRLLSAVILNDKSAHAD